MKDGRRCVISIAIVIIFSMVLIGAQSSSSYAAEKIYKWRCQVHLPAASTSFKPSCEGLINKLQERTNGRLQIELYPAGSLIPSKEIFNSVKRGMIEMGMAAASYYRDQVPLAYVASGLPFNFKDTWECAYYYQNLGFEKMMRDECAKHGVYFSSDKVIPTELCLSKPVTSLEDFKGLKLRSSGVSQLFLTSIGSAASYFSGTEVYPALSSGVVDGAHWGGIGGNMTMGLYEIAKYQFKPSLNITGMETWLINQKALDKLPKDMQEIVYTTLTEHFWKITNLNCFRENEKLAKIQKEMGVKITGPNAEEFVKIQNEAKKMWDEVAKKGPQCAKAVQMLKDFNKSMGR